jgi:hypothetical protein
MGSDEGERTSMKMGGEDSVGRGLDRRGILTEDERITNEGRPKHFFNFKGAMPRDFSTSGFFHKPVSLKPLSIP